MDKKQRHCDRYNFPTRLIRKIAVFSHRWTGTAFCLLFSWWFVSGIFMMYCDFPEVKETDRLARSQPIDASRVHLSASDAWAELKTQGVPDEMALAMFDGHPAWLFRLGRSQTMVYADDGQIRNEFPPDVNLRTAASWTAQPPGAAKARVLTSEDQWTVGGIYRRNAPLTKYSWPNGEQVYVSGVDGQVVQYTTRRSRLGAWLGPIPHWLYFTALRNNPRLWSRIVIWLSGAATVVAILGLIAGLIMYSPTKRYRSSGIPTSIPYAGPKRLHMILGLFFGLLACTWAFSGMLSMDPFPMPGTHNSEAASAILEALSGDPFTFEAFAPKHPREALTQVAAELKVKRLELLIVAGEPFYLATEDARHSMLIPVKGAPEPEFNRGRLLEIVRKASQPVGLAETRFISDYDAYYLDRHGALPLPALRVRLKDPRGTAFYIDLRTARVVAGYSSGMWVERWAYHGFHSMNLPWLYKHRPAWDILVLTLMLGGTSLSVTSVIIGWKLLRRKRAAFLTV